MKDLSLEEIEKLPNDLASLYYKVWIQNMNGFAPISFYEFNLMKNKYPQYFTNYDYNKTKASD